MLQLDLACPLTMIEPVLPSAPAPSLSGQTLANRYRIQHLLGRGGFADVYLANHLEIESLRVAVKVLHGIHRQRDMIVERFKREASLLATLRNRHTVRLIDFGFTESNAPFLVMEYVEGASLDRIIRNNAPLRETDTARLAIHVLKALAEAHDHGIVHRDLKPANVLMVREPGERHAAARVLDFGIAKVMGDPQVSVTQAQLAHLDAASTRTDQVFCTPLYAAPELLLGTPDFRTDLYALGLVMAEMLDGHPPYLDVDVNLDKSPHLLSAPVPLGEKTLNSALSGVVQQAVAKRLDERYQSAEEMLAAVQDVYATLRLPAEAEVPLEVRTPPPVDESVIELRASQFVPIVSDGTQVVALSPPEPTPLPPMLVLTHEAQGVSEFATVVQASPQVQASRRRLLLTAAVVAMATVFALSAMAIVSAGPADAPPAIAAAPDAVPPAPVASTATAPSTPVAPPVQVAAVSAPAAVVIERARWRVEDARWAALSTGIVLRANAPARVLIDGEERGVLVLGDDGTWRLPTGVSIPSRRPLQLSLVSEGVVYTHHVLDDGPVRMDVDLMALVAQGEADEAPRPRRRSSRRSRRAETAAAPTSLLGPSVTPRTQ